LPRPIDVQTVFLGAILLLALLSGCYVATEIVLPIVLAFVLNLVLQPAMRARDRGRIRRGLAALLIILALFATLAGFGDGALGARGELGATAPELAQPSITALQNSSIRLKGRSGSRVDARRPAQSRACGR